MCKNHTLPAFFLFLLCAAMLAACGQTDAQSSDDAQTTASVTDEAVTSETAETVDPAYRDDLGEYDYNGEEFHILLYGDGDPYNWSEIDVLVEGETGETINDGIYARNLALEERLNIKLTGQYDLNATGVLTKAVQAGDASYDAAFLRLSMAGTAAQSGAVYDWNDIPNVDMSKKYWDQSIIRDLSIGGNVYFMTGDISTIDNQATWIMMFNKAMIANNDLTSPYELVNTGKWTVDTFSAMTKDVAADLNGDGNYTMSDKYGLSTTIDTVYGLFYSTGLSFVSKDDGDMPYFNLDIDKATDVLAKIGTILNDGNRTLLSKRISNETSDVITGIRNAFFEDRALFYAEVMFHVANLRQMETDFGIIPLPKYDEAQEDYITFVNPAGSCLTIPVTVADLDMTGVVLEAMASASYEYLTPAYYTTALQNKYARDNESSAMLDLLLENRVYDLAMIYSWGNITSGYADLADKDSTDLASLVAKKEKQINTAIEKFIAAFENIE
ncbi:MAG: hypothetical protein IJ449_13805 [Clostridia bacterium]|nr:hypothetical protein [Clostridia bacterium]